MSDGRRCLAIVVSYNDVQNTLSCVTSLKAQARVVVWDNASRDSTVDRLGFFHPDVEVHANDYNALWTPALNGAIDKFYDGEDFILFSNNDIVYRPDTINQLMAAFDTKGTGITAPAGSGLGGQQDFVSHRPCPKGIDFNRWVSRQPTVRATYLVGASMMVSKECWTDLGPLDETMPLGADDHDYCLRAKEAGYTLWVVNSAYVNHKSHASALKAKDEWSEYGKKSWDAFNEKWAGYFYNEEEALKVHWRSGYTPGWDRGTGWMNKKDRAAEWAKREE